METQLYGARVPPDKRGGSRVVTKRGVGCGGRESFRRNSLRRRTRLTRTANTCGPGAPWLALSLVGDALRGDGDSEVMDTGESTKQPLKPLRRESRIVSAYLWRLTRVLFSTAREAVGARTPGFPCALSFEKGKDFRQHPGARRRGNAGPRPRRVSEKGPFRPLQEADGACLSPVKFSFGNRVLTLISVWLGA